MTFEWAAKFAQSRQEISREIAGLGKHGVQERSGVSFTQDETVALRPVRVLRIVAQEATEEEADQQLHAGKRAGGMARTGGGGASNDFFANRLGLGLQTGQVRRRACCRHEFSRNKKPNP